MAALTAASRYRLEQCDVIESGDIGALIIG
jgi:hypothetical protein